MRKIQLILLLLSVVLIGCNEKEAVTIKAPVMSDKYEPIISSEAVKPLGLKMAWSNVVPVQKSEKLTNLEITGPRLYAFTNYNYVSSMDSANCNPVISSYAGKKGTTITGWKLWQDSIYSAIGSDLVEIDWRSGNTIRSQRLGFGPSCPPVRNRDFYYLAGPDKRLRVYRSSDFVEVFQVAADDDSAIIAVTADEDMVIFGTNTGLVAAIQPDRPVQLWKFNAARGVNSPIIRNSGMVFFSSNDTCIYALDENTGELLWKYRSQALLKKPPVVTNRFLYQNVDGGGLIALDKRSGKLIWQLSEGLDLLAESKMGTYVLGKNNELILLDAVKWEKVDSVNLPSVSLHISNVTNSKIYLADKSGRIICLDSAY